MAIASILVVSTFSPVIATADRQYNNSPPQFEEGIATEEIGDIAYFTIDFSTDGMNNTIIQIGDKQASGYVLKAELSGEVSWNEDVKIAFDTTAAGDPSEKTLYIADGGDEDINLVVTRETRLTDPPIDPAVYDMVIIDSGSVADLGQLELNSVESIGNHEFIRQKTSDDTRESFEKIKTGTNTVAEGDYPFIRFNSSGTMAYLTEEYDASDFEKNGVVHQKHGIYVTFKNTREVINEDKEKIGLENVQFYTDSENEKLGFLIQTQKYDSISTNSEFNFSVHVSSSNQYLDSGTESTVFKVVERKGEFETDKDNKIYAEAGDYITISGTSSVAEETEVTFVARRNSEPNVLIRERIEIDEDGAFSTRIRVDPDLQAGAEIELGFLNMNGNAVLQVTEDGEPPQEQTTTKSTERRTPVGSESTQNIQTTPTTKQPNTERTTTDRTSTKSETTTEDDNSFPAPPTPGTPGFGAIVALLSVVLAAIAVARSD
jgi:hypothetical protein